MSCVQNVIVQSPNLEEAQNEQQSAIPISNADVQGDTHLLDGLQCLRRQLDLDTFAHCVGKEPFGLDVGQPGASGLALGEGDVVSELLHFAMEEAKLGALEGCADYMGENGERGEHLGEMKLFEGGFAGGRVRLFGKGLRAKSRSRSPTLRV